MRGAQESQEVTGIWDQMTSGQEGELARAAQGEGRAGESVAASNGAQVRAGLGPDGTKSLNLMWPEEKAGGGICGEACEGHRR